MKKIIYVLVLLMTFCILYGEKRIVSEVANSGTFTTVTTENVTSILDKYFSDFEFGNKKYRLLITDDNVTYDYIREKTGRYMNIGVLFIPKVRKIMCQKGRFGITSAFFDNKGQVDTLVRNDGICTKRAAEKVLTLPGRIDM